MRLRFKILFIALKALDNAHLKLINGNFQKLIINSQILRIDYSLRVSFLNYFK